MGLAFRVEHLGSGAGHVLHSIGHGIGADLGQQSLGLGLVGRVGGVKGGQDGAVHHAALPDDAGQVAGVDALDADGVVLFQKAVQRLLTAPVGGGGAGFAHDVALCPDAVGLHVIVVHAVVADEGIGLGDDLAVVAGVGQGLLKAHHAGGEHHLAHGHALRAHGLSGKDHAVCQKKICVHSFPRFNAECCHIFSVLALSVSADALPPPPKWEALAVHAKFMVLPRALPLGELDVKRPERANSLTGSALLPASSCGCPDAPAAACPPCRWGTPPGCSWADPTSGRWPEWGWETELRAWCGPPRR